MTIRYIAFGSFYFLSVFVSNFMRKKLHGPMSLKFSGKVQGGLEKIPFNFVEHRLKVKVKLPKLTGRIRSNVCMRFIVCVCGTTGFCVLFLFFCSVLFCRVKTLHRV